VLYLVFLIKLILKFTELIFKNEFVPYGKQHFLITKNIRLELLKEVVWV